MAEEDWYGPFGKWTMRHLQLITGLLGGAMFTVFGLIGYDTGKRSFTATTPPATRWMGEILWHEVIIGIGFLVYAYYQFRMIKFERQFERKK